MDLGWEGLDEVDIGGFGWTPQFNSVGSDASDDCLVRQSHIQFSNQGCKLEEYDRKKVTRILLYQQFTNAASLLLNVLSIPFQSEKNAHQNLITSQQNCSYNKYT